MKISGLGKGAIWVLGAYFYASLLGGRLPYYVLYASIGVLLVSFLWTRTLGKIDIKVCLDSNRSEVGKRVIVKIQLTNKSVLPVPWVHCSMKLPEVFGTNRESLSFGLFLKSCEYVELEFPLECQVRGFFQWGSISLSAGDFFGILTGTKIVENRLNLLVRPKFFYLGKNCLRGIDKQFGDRVLTLKPGRQVSEFRGVRAYMPGDSLSRIHWKASVRAQRFLVKEYDSSMLNETVIFLDLSSPMHKGEGVDSSIEDAVKIAAAFAATAIQDGLKVGCAICCQDLMVVPSARSKEHLGLILDFLARALAAQGMSVDKALLQEGLGHARGTLFTIVTPSFNKNLVDAISFMSGKGYKIFVALIRTETYGETDLDLEAREQAITRLLHYGVKILFIDHDSDLRALFGRMNYEAC